MGSMFKIDNRFDLSKQMHILSLKLVLASINDILTPNQVRIIKIEHIPSGLIL